MPDINTPGTQMSDITPQAALMTGTATTPVPTANPSLISRIGVAARFVISGVTPATWFGPNQPLAPMAPDYVGGGRFDYPTGINLNYSPRSNEQISFAQMRALADSCDILRIVLEARKEQIAAMDVVVRPKHRSRIGTGKLHYDPRKDPEGDKAITDDQKRRIEQISAFLACPDREHSWDQWQRMLLEDLLVIDAPAIERRMTRGGKLYSLDIIDGATIKPLLDADGRASAVPDPAYQQVLHGVPAADFTRAELLYRPRNVRSNKIYGYSPVEQIIVTVNTAIRRSMSQLDYYLEGTQPDAFVGLPKDWNMQNIQGFQTYFDALLSGMFGKRRKVRFMPGDFKYVETKSPPLKDQYDEWLARIVCFALSVSPTPFITQVSRGSVEQEQSRALQEGKAPLQRWMKGLIDEIIAGDFDSPDLEMLYLENVEQNPKTQMEIDVGYAKAGIYTIDEVRVAQGLAAFGGAAATPMLATNVGYVTLDRMLHAPLPGTTQAPGENDHDPVNGHIAGPHDNANATDPSGSTSPAPVSEPAT